MLPDVTLTIAWNGDLVKVATRDLPLPVFFRGFQSSDAPAKTAEERRQAMIAGDRWANQALLRAILAPAIRTDADLNSLGKDARKDLIEAYFRAVGWLQESEETAPQWGKISTPVSPQEFAIAYSLPPAPGVLKALRFVATRLRIPPHIVWGKWAASEFSFTWRVLTGDQAVAKAVADDPFSDIDVEDIAE